MRKRKSKKIACGLAAGLIDGQLSAGWPFEGTLLADCEMSEDDMQRLNKSLRELMHELYRRGCCQ